MSKRDRDIVKVMSSVLDGKRTQVEASRLLKLSVRQVRRILRRLETEGDGGVIHRLRGRTSNRRIDEQHRLAVLAAYQKDYSDFGPTLASEKLSARGLLVSSETLRGWLLSAGLWERKRHRDRHRSRRARRECFGELVQVDTSIHDWFEGRGESGVLVAMIDDATSRLLARFHDGETVEAYMDVLGRWIERHGRPLALYTDHDSVFESQAKGVKTSGMTQYSRALEELGMQLILAGSPQAKGRVERVFGTLQDRLVKELRLADIRTRAEANDFLERVYLKEHNRRFSKKPMSANDGHLPLGPRNLSAILSLQHDRVVSNDYCIRFENRLYQLAKPALPGLRKGKVKIELRLDGTMAIRFGERYLKYSELGALPPDPQSLTHPQQPAVIGKAGEAANTTSPSAVTLTSKRSGRTPAEPCPLASNGKVRVSETYRPPASHPWRKKCGKVT